ncbi:hypothetical protein [Amycolatopsis sp. lyj-346]|uniref:hypothetical protein n=1 Tax=Amycolatopsis sp. lyj-346 TaxID=2789289 RepID=UPI0039786894
MAVSVVGWLGVAVLVAGGAAGGLLWFLGWPQLPASRQFDVGQLLDLLKITLSVVAGFGGVVLLAVSYRKQRVAEDEHALAVQRADREVVQKFNERFGSAAEQLANESPAVRLAGVYAMAGLADDWADKRQVCVDVLCGYLRITREGDGEIEVREAILRVIRDRTTGSWSALDFDFTGVTMENADFARRRFAGEVLFVGAEFAGGKVDFADAFLQSSSVAFFRCRFTAPVLDFRQLDFAFGRLVFDRCDFTDLELDLSSRRGYGSAVLPAPVLAENCRFERCRVDLSGVAGRIRLTGGVLDTVTVVDQDDDDEIALPWQDVELRGGTALPSRRAIT